MEERLIKIFKEYLPAWSWEEWQAAGASDKEAIVINALADLGPDMSIEVDEAYDIFWDWAAGLTEADFNTSLTEAAQKQYKITYREDGVSKSFTVQAGSKAEAERIGWSKVDADSLYVSEVVNEAADINASINFWDLARDKKISTYWFHRAFDDELTELGLMDIFNEDGMLKNQGVWGRIKPVKEANPDSWAIKALNKMWWLQFKEGVTKSEEQIRQQIRREREEAETAERRAAMAAKAERDRIAREAKYAAAKEDWDVLNEKLPSIQTLVTNIAEEFAAEKKAILIPDLETAIKLKAEIKAATKGIISFYDSTEEYLAKLNSSDATIKVATTLNEPDMRWPYARIFVKVSEFFGETPGFSAGSKEARDYISFTVDNIDEETIKSEVLALLNDIWEVVSFRRNSLPRIQKQYDEVMTEANVAKAAQAAVDAGKPVDPNFISKILTQFKEGKKAAQKQADFYSDTTDGSAGAAYAMKASETLIVIGTYLINCNWRAVVNGKEIAAWRKTESLDNLEDELMKVFKAFCPELMIEIIK